MKTVIVTIPDRKEKTFSSYLKKNRFKSKFVSAEDIEDAQLAAWIDEGMKTEEVPLEKIYELLEKKRS